MGSRQRAAYPLSVVYQSEERGKEKGKNIAYCFLPTAY
jgi:hypothetical protein